MTENFSSFYDYLTETSQGRSPDSLVTDTISSVAISPDNQIVVGGGWKKIIIWNAKTGKLLHSIEGHSNWVLSVAISPDNKFIASGSADKTIKIWSRESGKLVKTLKNHSNWVNVVAFTPDGKTLVSGSADKTVKVWNFSTGKCQHTFKKHSQAVRCLAISSDGEILASGSADKTIKLWDLKSKKYLHSFAGHSDWVQGVYLSPNKEKLIGISRDGEVKVWQAEAEENQESSGPRFIQRIKKIAINLRDLKNLNKSPNQIFFEKFKEKASTNNSSKRVNSLAIIKEAFITGTDCGSIEKFSWSGLTRLQFTIKSGSNFITSIAVSSDNKIVVSGSENWAKLWNLKTGELLHPLKGGSPRLCKITISPKSVDLKRGKTQFFKVKGFDQNNSPISVEKIDWSVTGRANKIDQNGNLTVADDAKEKFKVIATAEANISAEAEITPLVLTSLEVTPRQLEIHPGKRQKLTVRGKDQKGQPIETGEISWKVTPKEAGNIDQDDNLTVADNAREKFKVIATATKANISAEAEIIPLILTSLEITPKGLEINPGKRQKLTVRGKDQKGQPIETGEISWKVTPEEAGNIDQDDNLTVADNAREKFKVIATATKANISAEAEIIPLILTSLEITPKGLEINPGKRQKLTVRGKDQKGQPIETGEISWKVTPKEAGNIDQNGNLTVADDAKEKFKVTATAEPNISAEAEITPLILTYLKITPKRLETYPGNSKQFIVEGKDQKGQPIKTGEISWRITPEKAGNIDESGNLTVADDAKEKFKVTATAEPNISAEAEIIPLILTSLKITPKSLETYPGSSKQFIVEGKDQKGQPIETGKISWKVTPKEAGNIDESGNLTVADDAKEKLKVIATAEPNISAEAEIIPLILTSLKITPKSLETYPGSSKQFIVEGKDQKGQPIETGKISWKVTPKEAGNIDESGNLTVADDAKEKFKVTATAEPNISVEAEIIPLILTSLKITPKSLEVYPGSSHKLTVRGKDQKGQPIETGEISWRVTPEEAGNIDQDDNLTVADDAKEKFKVTATAEPNISAEAEIIPLILTSLEITPKSLEVYPGSSHKLTVRGKDQKGQPIETGEISWRVTPEEAGNIDQDDNLTVADNARDKFKVIATAESNISAEAEIIPLILTYLKITPKRLEVYPGSKEQFTVEGKDQKGQPIDTGEISWKVTPEEAGNIDWDGNLTVADNARQKFKVIATATEAHISAEAEITPLILTYLEVTSKSREIYPGQTQQFAVEGKDQKGQTIETGEISWRVRPEAGNIDKYGRLTVADYAKGKFKVTATATEANISGEAEITVPAVPVELKVFPEAISVKPEEPVTFEAFCLDQHGEYLDLINVYWQCTAGGSIDNSGTFVGGYEQRQVTVTATVGDVGETAIATLLPVLRRLEISPNTNLQLKPGDRKEFRTVGYDQYGQKINTSGIFWEATGGQIDSNGVFTVDANAKGTYRVTASESGIKYQWQLWGVYIGILAQVIDFIDKIVSFCESPVGAFLTNYLLPSSERSNDNGDTTEVEIDNPEEMGLQLDIWSLLSDKLVRAIIRALDWISNKLLKAGGISASVEVRVIPVLKRLEISSREPRVECQKSLRLALTGFDQRGERIAVKGAEWQATDGTITPAGVLTAGNKEGSITVTAIIGEISASVSVEVRAIPVLKRLEISPREPRVECQKSLTLALTGFDQRGKEIAIGGAEWQATGGTITSKGFLTAGNKKGYITVTAAIGEISDRVSVEVIENAPSVTAVVGKISDRVSVEIIENARSVKTAVRKTSDRVPHSNYLAPRDIYSDPSLTGLVSSLATHARVNDYGFIETPYFAVENGRVLREQSPVYMTADEEDDFRIAPGDLRTDADGYILGDNVPVRYRQDFTTTGPDQVDFVAVSPVQVVSVAASLIPFLEHDDQASAVKGVNAQKQAVPLLKPERPLVGTGLETQVARDSGAVIVSRVPGEVSYVDATQIRVMGDDGIEVTYDLLKYARSNQGTCLNQRPLAYEGDRVEAGQVIADGSSTEGAELALGENVLVAYMPWEGYNYADAILISERLVADDVYTSIHIEKFEIEARQTKLGPEEITREIPNVGEDGLRNLDDQGIIRIGAWVESGEILVGKVTPKGESDQPPEEKLLRAMFGEKARDVRDNSLRVPNGEKGRVVDVRVFTREKGYKLPLGANMVVRVYVAQKRKIQVGDKMAGRHGNKGVVSRILPIEDMPFLPDGRAIDLVLNPLGVPSQMNVGQIFECLLGWAGEILGARFKCVPFDEMHGAEMSRETVHGMLRWAREISGKDWVFDENNPGRIWLYDGRTGERFDRPVMVGTAYMLKLVNLVDDKIHARSTGSYSLRTQQPLDGKAQQGGQRFGEMEVWALEAFGAAYTLQELLTVKSDDMQGRNDALKAIFEGKAIPKPGTPESFKTLIQELQSLCLDIAAHKVEFDEHTGTIRHVEVDLMAELQRTRLPSRPVYESLGQEDEDE